MKVPTRVIGQRLDVALRELRESEAAEEGSETESITSLMLPVADESEAEQHRDEDITEAMLIDFIMPIVSDVTIFQNNRVITLLEYLQTDLMTELDNREELADLANQIIEDEIARHHLIAERRQREIAA